MTTTSSLNFLLFSIALIVLFTIAHALKLQPPTAIHFPIRKNGTTLQYYTTFEIGSPESRATVNAMIDLGGQYVWFDCDAYKPSSSYSYLPISCGSTKCKTIKGSGCLGCYSTPKPGCTNNTCAVFAFSAIQNLVVYQVLGEDTMKVYGTNGATIGLSYDSNHFKFSCAETSVLDGLPRNNINGLAGLGRTTTSLHKQISLSFKLPDKFALCIPSSSTNGLGDIFIGGGPYYMPPISGDQSKSLATTPLLVNPIGIGPLYFKGDPSDEYFIQVNGIEINGKGVPFNNSLLSIDENGVGGTKLSVVTPYTVLHSSIYNPLISHFVNAAALNNIKRVKSILPFGACFSTKGVAETKTGPAVPSIDLVVQGISTRLRLYGANSMVRVNKNVMCLAFVDGGAQPTTSIVLGGHQLENFLLEFDLASSKLGFSSSLLLWNSSCSHYRLS